MTTHPRSPAIPNGRMCARGVLILTLTETTVSVECSVMQSQSRVSSARQRELLERAYAYLLKHGLTGLSLRPLAQAIGSSPRVLLSLFGSKEGLVQALLARARTAQLELLSQLAATGSTDDFVAAVRGVWRWLAARQHR